ncbi:hypothetical protein TNCT_252321 [Trichonephila clavata]|uniref:RING-type domain-containing protein n=1 Tax=Trichonephila clavata TaxID=2740835 RepID=A0A8X6JED7_TRICU|nr:hypothetical protein TNCT_252321 [Trichonephila clavata]
MDLQSITGTFLNGKLLKPNLPYRLRDGFVIFLGYPTTSTSAFMFRIKKQDIQKFQASCIGNGESLESSNSLSRPELRSDPQVLDHTDCSAGSSFIVILNEHEVSDGSNAKACIPRVLAHEEDNIPVESTLGVPALKSSGFNQQSIEHKPSTSGLQAKKDKLASKQNLQMSGADYFKFVEEENSSETKKKTDMDEPIENPFKQRYILAKKKLLECQKELESLKEAEKIKTGNCIKKVLENDFTCIICTEILIKPVLLKCSHSFCRRCIRKWKMKQNKCPICREKIINSTENDTLEYFINSTTELLDEEYINLRKEAIKNRKAVEDDDHYDDPYEEMLMDGIAEWGSVMDDFYDNETDDIHFPDVLLAGPSRPFSIDSDA